MGEILFNDLIELRPTIIYSNRYVIYLRNTEIMIGTIDYRGYHCSTFLGDVGFTIYPKFRGNNYAYEALVLLSEKLYENGIPDFWITTYDDNLPSIRTIEKYGGKLIRSTEENILLFECKTRKIIRNDNQIFIKK